MACDAELDKRKSLQEERDLCFVWRVLCTLDTGHDGPHRSSRGWRWTNKYAVDGGTAQYNAFAPEALPPPRVGRTPLPDAREMRRLHFLLTYCYEALGAANDDIMDMAEEAWQEAEALDRDGGKHG